jgi:hypothetical protein
VVVGDGLGIKTANAKMHVPQAVYGTEMARKNFNRPCSNHMGVDRFISRGLGRTRFQTRYKYKE